MKKSQMICTYRPFAGHLTRFVVPQTPRGADLRKRGFCGLLTSTSGPQCVRPADHVGACSGTVSL
jgi:hypothetical protein